MLDAFGRLPDGQEVTAVSIKGGGLTARILTHGARVQDLRRAGEDRSLVIGASRLEPYLDGMRYFGALVGRFANRIAGASFDLEGTHYALDRNWLGKHTLHGGDGGTDQLLWTIADTGADRVRMRLCLGDGDMGFPGTLEVSVLYLLEDGALKMEVTAETDQATPCSFAHHGYFRLRDGDAREGELQVRAARILEVDADLIPVSPVPVDITRYDFREMKRIGTVPLDHNFCLDGTGLRPVAAYHAGGRTLQVETDQPGLQVFDGSNTVGTELEDGTTLPAHAGIALETQAWPDAPNRPDFPPAILHPGETYRHRAIYRILEGRVPI